MNETIVIVGLGLIGGSIAKALRGAGSCRVLGMDLDEDVLLDAISCGAIAEKAGVEDLKSADLVYLCLYPKEALEFAQKYGPLLKEGCVLTDTCGVKAEICAGLSSLQGTGKYVFVGGHPMAGKEHSGFAASDGGLFAGASYIVTPCGAPDWAVEKVLSYARRMGFGKFVTTTPERHDRAIAFTSQTPHVLACAYVMSPRCPEHHGFSAGSYRDVSRVADINSALWTRLFLMNRGALVEELDELTRNLGLFRDAVAAGDEPALRSLLEKARAIKTTQG